MWFFFFYKNCNHLSREKILRCCLSFKGHSNTHLLMQVNHFCPSGWRPSPDSSPPRPSSTSEQRVKGFVPRPSRTGTDPPIVRRHKELRCVCLWVSVPVIRRSRTSAVTPSSDVKPLLPLLLVHLLLRSRVHVSGARFALRETFLLLCVPAGVWDVEVYVEDLNWV